MKIFLCSSFWILFLTLIPGCGPGNNKMNDKGINNTSFERGKIIPKVTCRKDQNISYALYLPNDYTPARKFPVIIAFDPKGDGILPLEKYKSLADKYGYILMGSNDSKNGQDMNTTGVIVDALFSEMTGRYSIDSGRIYVMGFSGGARVASVIGFYQGGVNGVIGCGAGLPATDQPVRFKPDYITMVGNADFNMNELINLDKQLDQANFTHALILFNGKHEWPPDDVMENAFIWNEFCSMRKGFIQKNDSRIIDFVHSREKIISNDKETNNILAEQDHLINLIRFVNGLVSTEDLKKSLAEIENSSSYKMQQKQLQQVIEKEMKEQQFLNDNFFSKDIGWWKKKNLKL